MSVLRLIIILILVLLFGIVVIQNRGPVQTHFLFFTLELPHILLLLLTLAGGFILGLLVALFFPSAAKKRKEESGKGSPLSLN